MRRFLTVTILMVLVAGMAMAQSVERCKFSNGVIAWPNYVLPILVSSTSVVTNVSISQLNPGGGAMMAVIGADNATYGICPYGISADRCGTSMPLTSGGGGGYLPGSVMLLNSISNTAVVGLKVGSQVSPTHVFVGLCSL